MPLRICEKIRNWAHIDVNNIKNKARPETNMSPLQSCCEILNRLQKSLAEIHTGRLGHTTVAVRWLREVMTTGLG